jgi:hypothetical protein
MSNSYFSADEVLQEGYILTHLNEIQKTLISTVGMRNHSADKSSHDILQQGVLSTMERYGKIFNALGSLYQKVTDRNTPCKDNGKCSLKLLCRFLHTYEQYKVWNEEECKK